MRARRRDNETALPLLEFALTRIWEGMQAGKKPEATLREIGGAGGALAGRAQAIYKALGAAEQATAQRALVRMVQLGEGTRDTRRRVPLRELCGRGQTETEVLAVLRHFATENARLVTMSGDGTDTVAEVLQALADRFERTIGSAERAIEIAKAGPPRYLTIQTPQTPPPKLVTFASKKS